MTSEPWTVGDTEEALIESLVNYLKFDFFLNLKFLSRIQILELQNGGCKPWTVSDTEEALIESQVKYLKF